jgi:hypothetical protein
MSARGQTVLMGRKVHHAWTYRPINTGVWVRDVSGDG